MTRISRRKINGDNYEIAYKQLIKLLSGLQNKNAHFLIDELLTETERVMLVKRFAAIFMFQQEYTPYRVSVTVDISESTSQRLYQGFLNGSYDNLLACIQKNEKSEFLDLLKDLMLSRASYKARTRLINRALK
jgi:Trp operon repressor